MLGIYYKNQQIPIKSKSGRLEQQALAQKIEISDIFLKLSDKFHKVTVWQPQSSVSYTRVSKNEIWYILWFIYCIFFLNLECSIKSFIIVICNTMTHVSDLGSNLFFIFNIFRHKKCYVLSSNLSKSVIPFKSYGNQISNVVSLSWTVCKYYNHGIAILRRDYVRCKLSTISMCDISICYMGLWVNNFMSSKSVKIGHIFTLFVFCFEITTLKIYSWLVYGQCYDEVGINDVIKLIVKLSLVQTNNNNNSCYLRLNWYHNQHI